MPTLNTPKKTNNNQHKQTDMRKLRQKAYQSKEWRALRDNWMKMHPLCEECLLEGKVTPAEDVHHVRSPFKDGVINYQLLLDKNNLTSLCKKCHGNHHTKEQGHQTTDDIIKKLETLLNDK